MKITELNLEKFEKAAAMLKAMAHPTRIAMLNMLGNGKKLSVSEIHKGLSIEQSIASHHLGILKKKDILNSERKGKCTFYYLKNNDLEHILNCVNKCTNCEG